MNIKYIISLSALSTLTCLQCWGAAADSGHRSFGKRKRSTQDEVQALTTAIETVHLHDQTTPKDTSTPTAKRPRFNESPTNMSPIVLTKAAGSGKAKTFSAHKILLRAARNKDPNRLSQVLQKIDINIVDRHGVTALMLAAVEGNKSTVAKLLEHGASIDAMNINARSALMGAMHRGHGEVAQLLIKAGANTSHLSQDQLKQLDKWGLRIHTAPDLIPQPIATTISTLTDKINDIPLFHQLVERYNNNALMILFDVVQNNYPESIDIIKYLVEIGTDINAPAAHGRTVLMYSAFNGYDTIIALMIKANANINATDENGSTALMHAVFNGHHNATAQLLQAKADVNAITNNSQSALMLAAQAGHTTIVAQLLDKGANINAINNNGFTPLMCVGIHGRTNVATQLILAGANINITNNEGKTALMIAIGYDHPSIADQLIRTGADVNVADDEGWTALMVAIDHDDEDLTLIKQLMQAGADVNATNIDGWTPLMMAAAEGYEDIADELIQADAHVNTTTTDDRTALTMAVRNGHEQTAQLLIKNEADSANLPADLQIKLDEWSAR